MAVPVRRMGDGQSYTLLGALLAAALGFGPRLWDRWAGRKKEAADGAEVLAGGAGAVTAAAVALLARHDEDAARARAAEAQCRRDLATANERIDAGEAELAQLHVKCAELTEHVATLRAYQSGQ